MNIATPPLVGRHGELHLLGAVYGDARSGRSQVVSISGAAGVGKSRLLSEAGAAAIAAGFRVVASRGWDGPGTPSLWPWRQVLRTLAADPEPSTVLDDYLQDGGGDHERFRMFDSVTEVLARSALDQPLVVVIDDLHWADPASVELARFVADHLHERPFVLVLAHRGAASMADGGRLLERIERYATVIDVAGLGSDDVADLIEAFGGAGTRGLAQELTTATNGLPLLIIEILRHLVRSGRDVDDWDAIPVPDSLRATVAELLGAVSHEARALAQAAAVQGRDVDTRLALAAAAIREPTRTVDELDGAGLGAFRIDGSSFEHALVAAAVLELTDPERVRALHRTTAHALRTTGGDPETVALHLVEAGDTAAPTDVVDAAVAAGATALRRLAWERAVHWYNVAADRSEGGDRLRHLLSGADAARSGRLAGDAKRLVTEAAQLARTLDDPASLAAAALLHPPSLEGVEIDDLFDPDQLALRREAFDALGPDEPALRARLGGALALSMYWDDRHGARGRAHEATQARRDQLTGDALAVARNLGAPELLAECISNRIYATWGPAQHDARPVLGAELSMVATEAGDVDRALYGRVWVVVDLLERGELLQAELEIDAFSAQADQRRHPVHRWTAARWRGNLALLRGDLAAAEAAFEEAEQRAVRFIDPEVAFHFTATSIGPIRYLQGRLGEVQEFMAQMVAANPNVPAWRVGHCCAAAENGDLDAAGATLSELRAGEFAALPRDLNFTGVLVLLSLPAHWVGDEITASWVFERLHRYQGRLAIHGTGYASYGTMDRALGMCAEVMGEWARAEDLYRSAISLADRVGSPYAGMSRLDLGRLLAAGSDTDRVDARSALTAGIDLLDAAGLDVMADRGRHSLRSLDDADTVVLLEGPQGWELGRAGSTATLPPLKGLRALRALVRAPGHDIHVLDLAAALEGRSAAKPPETVDPMLDETARSGYRARIGQLRADLDRADIVGDAERSAELHAELDAVMDELSNATGLGGRARTLADDGERARVNVTKHLRRCVARIEEVDEDLGRHLDHAITTGYHCRYLPGRSSIRWRTA